MVKECAKCGHQEADNRRSGLTFCSVCIKFCPNDPEQIDVFVEEKINSSTLEPLRKYSVSRGQEQKKGMIKKASEGNLVSRAAFGYVIVNGKLVPAPNSEEIVEIFEEFLEDKMSLNKIAEKHNLSVNGLKKVLSNFTYIGKIKFNNMVYDGTHDPLVDAILFNKVQDKLEKITKKK